MNKVRKLSEEETKRSTIDSRMVSIRWDVVPWGLVFDLDVPGSESESESEAALMHRAWIVFEDMSDLYFPLINTRLPNGCWLTSQMWSFNLTNEFHCYEFFCILPSFDENNSLIGDSSKKVRIKAKNVIGLISLEKAQPTEGILGYRERNELALDDDYLTAYREVLENKAEDQNEKR